MLGPPSTDNVSVEPKANGMDVTLALTAPATLDTSSGRVGTAACPVDHIRGPASVDGECRKTDRCLYCGRRRYRLIYSFRLHAILRTADITTRIEDTRSQPGKVPTYS
jgi:hypothetical protein